MLVNHSTDPAWAWARYEPTAERPWSLRHAGHLYRRAAFGASWPQLEQALRDGPQRSIDKLLKPEADVAQFQHRFDAFEADARSGADALRAWWLRRMLETPQPLLEKMTLFWHGHFAISAANVESGPLMTQYLRLLRSQALGRFDRLLEAITREPAVLKGLEAAANRRAKPSESLAQAILEPFSLGTGRCSAQDVREAARAFTGQFVLHDEYRFIDREYDSGTKKILGKEGPWKGADVVRIALRQPVVARRIVGKLYRWLISESEPPDETLLTPLAETFAKDYDVGRLVETMLRSNLFFSATAYRQRIKSPVEYALGIVKGLDGLVPTAPLGEHLASLGQNLCYPPTVNGWEGGRAWINRATLVGRANLAQALLAGADPYGDALNPKTAAEKLGRTDPETAGRWLLDVFLQGDVSPGVVERLQQGAASGEAVPRLQRFAHALVALPEYQLA
ncbi:MAG: DUF1800 domain-containing protein [Thermoguttaceae bacterium]|jgi:uncharacterized protein (DUF1800 family)